MSLTSTHSWFPYSRRCALSALAIPTPPPHSPPCARPRRSASQTPQRSRRRGTSRPQSAARPRAWGGGGGGGGGVERGREGGVAWAGSEAAPRAEPACICSSIALGSPASPPQAHQGWNQSITVELTVARKRWERMRKASPTGEQVKATCKFLMTCAAGRAGGHSAAGEQRNEHKGDGHECSICSTPSAQALPPASQHPPMHSRPPAG